MLDNLTGSSEQDAVAKLQAQRSAANPDLETETTGGTDEAQLEASPVADESYDSDVTNDAAEGDEGDEPTNQPKRFRVKVDGEELEVDESEVINGYQRDADYRKKTMELAEERKAFEADKSARLEKLEKLIASQEKEIDWESLRDNDPSEYLKQRELQAERKEALNAEKSEQAKKFEAQRNEYIEVESSRLKDSMGRDWTAEKQKASFDAASEYLMSINISEDEINQLYDHRLWKMAFDAAEYAKLRKTQGRVSKEVREAPKSVKPGQRVDSSKKDLDEARGRLRNAPKGKEIDAAVAYLKKQRGN